MCLQKQVLTNNIENPSNTELMISIYFKNFYNKNLSQFSVTDEILKKTNEIKHGILSLYLLSSKPAININSKGIKESIRKNLLLIINKICELII